jgi:hypothetical protein
MILLHRALLVLAIVGVLVALAIRTGPTFAASSVVTLARVTDGNGHFVTVTDGGALLLAPQ